METLRDAGWRIWLEPRAVVDHVVNRERCRSAYYWRRLWWAGVSRAEPTRAASPPASDCPSQRRSGFCSTRSPVTGSTSTDRRRRPDSSWRRRVSGGSRRDPSNRRVRRRGRGAVRGRAGRPFHAAPRRTALPGRVPVPPHGPRDRRAPPADHRPRARRGRVRAEPGRFRQASLPARRRRRPRPRDVLARRRTTRDRRGGSVGGDRRLPSSSHG